MDNEQRTTVSQSTTVSSGEQRSLVACSICCRVRFTSSTIFCEVVEGKSQNVVSVGRKTFCFIFLGWEFAQMILRVQYSSGVDLIEDCTNSKFEDYTLISSLGVARESPAAKLPLMYKSLGDAHTYMQ